MWAYIIVNLQSSTIWISKVFHYFCVLTLFFPSIFFLLPQQPSIFFLLPQKRSSLGFYVCKCSFFQNNRISSLKFLNSESWLRLKLWLGLIACILLTGIEMLLGRWKSMDESMREMIVISCTICKLSLIWWKDFYCC